MEILRILIRLGIFLVIIFLFAISSPIYMRWMFKFYERLETYHPVQEEGLRVKIYKLWYYNGLASSFATGVAILYEPFISGIGVPFSLETIVASAVLLAVANFAIRLTSYSYLDEPNFPADRLKEDAHNAGYSLMVSIWILLFLGFGLLVANGNLVWTYHLPVVSIPRGLLYALIIIFVPGLLAYISEHWLHNHANVPDSIIDDFDGDT